MFGTYESEINRFGPFGIMEEARGMGLGKILLHLTLLQMRKCGATRAFFLWVDPDSPAGHLYAKTGFEVFRTFAIMSCKI